MTVLSSAPSTQTRTTPHSPINDISHRAHNLARILDRLSSGTYHLKIVKNEIHGADWDVEIVRSELIQRVSLSNKRYVSE